MSLLAELNTILGELSIRSETGVFSGTAPDTYVVLTPVSDRYDVFADNRPGQDVEEVRISLYTKGNYRSLKGRIEHALLDAGLTITDRTYVGREDDTGYYHYAIDVANHYELEEI